MNDAHCTAAGRGPFLPLLLFGLAVLGWTGFQTFELAKDHGSYTRLLAAQEPQVGKSAQIRAALNGLASDTQRLAQGGDAGARVVVDQLRRQGITIHPDAAASPLPP